MGVCIGDTPEQLEQGLLIDGDLWTKDRINALQAQVEQLQKSFFVLVTDIEWHDLKTASIPIALARKAKFMKEELIQMRVKG